MVIVLKLTKYLIFFLLISFSVIFSNELIAVMIFVVVGFVFGILPELIGKNEEGNVQ